MTIRPERPSDLGAIDAIHRAAFAGHPHSKGAEGAIVRALRRRGTLAVSLVAELDGAPVGHIAISPVRISDGTSGWYGLGPLAVRPVNQRSGIGQRLVLGAMHWLRTSGALGCLVVGEPAYYARFGFLPNARLRFPGVPPEFFQTLCFGGTTPQGCVTYDEAFGEARQ